MADSMAGQSVEEEPDLPEEVTESLESFHEALGKVEDVFKPLLETSVDDLKEKMNPLQSAKLDLVVAYAVNSMFWMYLTTQGVNPRQHPVKSELDRIKKYMGKVKEATEKKEEMTEHQTLLGKLIKNQNKKIPGSASARIDKEAAKRFVKSALWEPSDKEKTSQNEGETSLEEDSKKNPEKRKSEGKPSAKKKRKR